MKTIKPWPEQLELATKGIEIIKEHALVYLAMEERTGKTLTAILIAEDIRVTKVLVITKKKAMQGWFDTIAQYNPLCSYLVINHHSLHNIPESFKPDLVIIDEAHAYFSGYPKRSKMWLAARNYTIGKPIIFISATPKAQGAQLLYNQLALSDWSPWAKFKDFFAWYKHYAERDKEGKFKMGYVGAGVQALDYTAVRHEEVYNSVKHLFITKTRAELGFEQEPEDVVHYIELDAKIKAIYNTILTKKAIAFTHAETGKDYNLICDSGIKLRWALHMLEGGTLKIDDEYIDLGNKEKVDYILKTWGDSKDLVIMYQYKADKIKLEKYFKNALILQAQTYSEGVDLSMYKHLVIYSQDFSTAKHTQRRARQANRARVDEIKVHFLLVKKAISAQVYKTVSKNKTNFVDSVFEKELL